MDFDRTIWSNADKTDQKEPFLSPLISCFVRLETLVKVITERDSFPFIQFTSIFGRTTQDTIAEVLTEGKRSFFLGLPWGKLSFYPEFYCHSLPTLTRRIVCPGVFSLWRLIVRTPLDKFFTPQVSPQNRVNDDRNYRRREKGIRINDKKFCQDNIHLIVLENQDSYWKSSCCYSR